MRQTAIRFARSVAALFYPQQNACHLCGRGLASAGEGILCARCEAELEKGRIPVPELAVGLHKPLAVCVSAYWHQDEARELVHLLKYRSDRAAAQPLGQGLCYAYASVLEETVRLAQLIAPVPLHPARRRMRGYNQALLLARELASHTGLPVLPDALERVRATGPQALNTREERLHAMRGAFAAPRAEAVAGRRVLLVDDVLTTGSTAVACAEALLKAGAREVSLLTACRA